MDFKWQLVQEWSLFEFRNRFLFEISRFAIVCLNAIFRWKQFALKESMRIDEA